MQSEFDFIARLRHRTARRSADLLCGIGDDTAIISEQTGRETLITADLLIEDVHFKTAYTPLHYLGHKALAVSLSDIAAMGGRPRFALLTLAIPETVWGSLAWDDFFSGYLTLADEYEVTLIGGDTSAAPAHIAIDSIVIGHCAAGRALRRRGAQVGDAIYVTGEIGASAVGLELLRRGVRITAQTDDMEQQALRAHLRPQPRVAFGHNVGEAGLAHAMIDVSDGLTQDLVHICIESGVGALLDFASVPVSAMTSLIAEDRETAFAFAVGGGEDYELLLTADSRNESELMELSRLCNLRLTRIGEITAADPAHPAPLRLRQADHTKIWPVRGYDHFA